MFWRKTREAIGRFHPVHQRLTLERTVSASAPPGEWANVLASLSRHETTVRRRKWRMPPRATEVLVPLIQALSEDTGPGGTIGVTADFRGPKAGDKTGPKNDLPVSGRVRKLTQWFVVDPWLRVRAELTDGSVVEIQVTDRIRHRRISKVTPRGKHKIKTKKKAVQRIEARRTLAKGATARRPATAPPGWVGLRIKNGRRTTLVATGKLPQVPGQDDQFRAILTVVTELFRWTPPQTSGRTA
ncbi:hypothetical protein [Actinoallomurus acaciae]|uniref:Uncharacterized protein n=1 Tax=Actinoallomurus acaciae TaxID=502577 RepID=A0ABV5YY30_9ACTN